MILVRRLGLADINEFLRIRLEGLKTDPISFGRTYAEQWARPRSDLERFLAPSRRRVLWGAFAGARMVGLIRLEAEGRSARRWIYSLYVAPEVRRRGVARRLLKTAITRAKRSPRVRQIWLMVETGNRAALVLYRSCGFVVCGIEHDTIRFEGLDYSEYFMRKFVRSRRST